MNHPVKSVCVYCGSRPGENQVYTSGAEKLGKLIASHKLELVYGAGSVGLMGITARAAIDAGAHVTGIIPKHLDAVEIIQTGLKETVVTKNMHQRKKLMFDRSDAFLILPGGLGTLDETFEIITWAQLNLHQKPVVLVNLGDYWNPLINLLSHIVKEGFASPAHQHLLRIVDTPEEALTYIRTQSISEEKSHSSLF